MYMDDTTMYMDMLPYDVNNPQKVEPNKLLLPELTDPWLTTQAGISDIQFPVTNTSSSTNLLGRLSPTMEQLANSLLPNEMYLPQIDDAFDIDVALDSITTQNNSLDAALQSLELESPHSHPQVVTQRRRSNRLSSQAPYMASYHEPDTSVMFQPHSAQHSSTLLNQSSAWSPVGDADGDDSSEGTTRVQRKRRPKVSYSTLTEDEKYHRIRYLNNEASKQYRERMRGQLSGLQEREIKEMERNRVLKYKEEGLEKLRNDIKAYTYNFFRANMGNQGVQ